MLECNIAIEIENLLFNYNCYQTFCKAFHLQKTNKL